MSSKTFLQKNIDKIYKTLQKKYPNVSTFLTHNSPFELLIAVILSAQCTDKRVNIVTPQLFKKYPTPKALGTGNLDEIANTIKSINFFNNKAKNIKKTASIIYTKHQNSVPNQLAQLTQLPGVGRKTANVVLGQAFGIPGITVDTHVKRVSQRLGFTSQNDPVKIEFDLMKSWPESYWNNLSTTFILHGRNTCKSQKPQCTNCILRKYCPQNGIKNIPLV